MFVRPAYQSALLVVKRFISDWKRTWVNQKQLKSWKIRNKVPKKSHETGVFLRKITKLQKLENHQNIMGKLIQKYEESFIAARRQPWLVDMLVSATSLRAFVSVCVSVSTNENTIYIEITCISICA